MGAFRKGLTWVFAPSWLYTMGKKPVLPWKNQAELLESIQSADKVSSVSVERFVRHIYEHKVSSSDQLRIMHRNFRSGLIYTGFLFLSLIIGVTFLALNSWGIWNSPWHSAIPFTCALHFLMLTLRHLHRAKQILVGAIFPGSFLIRDWRNLVYMADGVFLKGKLVHKAFPWYTGAYELLEKIESEQQHEER